jgi:hypothetical protein
VALQSGSTNARTAGWGNPSGLIKKEREIMKAAVYTLGLFAVLMAGRAFAADNGNWAGFGPFTLNELSLTGTVEVNSDCTKVWGVLTELEKMQKLAPHLSLNSPTGQKTAEQRGDVVRIAVQKSNGIMTGQFVLTTPVPYQRIQAVLSPDRGPWMRIQQWTLNPEDKKCLVDYAEAYNELWVKGVGIDGSGFIQKNRDHHMHVVLRRIKNMAEGKEPGPPQEIEYLFEDAKVFPDQFRMAR